MELSLAGRCLLWAQFNVDSLLHGKSLQIKLAYLSLIIVESKAPCIHRNPPQMHRYPALTLRSK